MKKLILTIIMAALWGGLAWAYDFSAVCSTGQTLYYTITSNATSSGGQNRANVVSDDINHTYLDFTGNLVIPSSVHYGAKTFSVTGIGESAFENCSGLTSVTIPNSVTSIDSYAFRNCSGLTSITIPSSITSIGSWVFYGSGLTTVNFNATNCTSMAGPSMPSFGGCPALQTLNIGSNVTNIPRYAFQDCSGLSGVLTIPNSVTSIDWKAFSGCTGLTSVTIPNSVTSIGIEAFSGCTGLTGTLTIPNSVTSIEHSAFKNCSGLTSVTIPSSITNIESSTFSGCNGLTSVTIHNSVTSIGSAAFGGCSGLTTVNFNATNCTTMGNSENPVFKNCNENAVINIGANVMIIPNYAFKGLRGNGSLTIPNSVTSIGESAFYGCSGLTSLTIPNSITNIGDYVFYGCSGLTSVTIPNSVTSIGSSAFRNCSGLSSVTVGNSVTSIGASAFYGCSVLTSVYYTGDVAGWCGISFADGNANPLNYTHNLYINNESVTDLVIPSMVTTIKNYAFYNATSLTSITISNSVTSIGDYAFYSCSGLASITIGESVTGIGDYAFSGCSGLTSMTVPNSVTSIGRGAFRSCSSLIDITIPFVGGRAATSTTLSETSLLGYIFGYSTSSQTGTIQQYYSSSGKIYAYIPSSLRSVTVTGGLLAYGAFYNCSMLTSVTIGEDVTRIFDYAFYNCSGLTDIYVNRTTPPTATSYSFNNRTATVWVPCGSATAYSAATGWSGFSDIRESRAFMLNVSSVNPQQGIASVTQQPDCTNGTAVIVAIPNIGYTFAQWNDGNTDNPRTITVTSDISYIAEFGISQHTITIVSADEVMGTVSNGGTYNYGTEIQISATANAGYRFTAWNDGNTDNPRTITVTQDSTFTANFIAIHTITIQSNNDEMGSVSGGDVYDENTEIQISATPADHYHFVQWSDGNTDNPRTITVTEDATYTAEFAIDQHTITVESANAEMGTVSESGTYDYGTEIEISATPNDGYRFVSWNDENTDNPRIVVVTQDSTFTANFVAIYTITVLSENEEMGSVDGGGIYDENTEIEISATPAEHYHFTQWNDENTDNPRRLIVTEDAEYTASFAIDQHTITVESSDTAMGTVSEGGTYNYGTEIEISATAKEHYHFVQWSDGNTDNLRTIIVTEDATYTAEFAIDQHTITVESADNAMGTVSDGGTYDYGTEIQISATAATGYEFAQWTDGNTDNPRTIIVTENATYIAEFVPATGINENTILEISLFPNPTNNILNITSSEIISEIEIVNALGQVVSRTEVNADNAVCDVEGLTAGVYVVRIYGADADSIREQRKFVKE